VASCKADKAGEVKHVEALCKLGIATAPSAFGDAFPVMRYALVHGASAGKALECSSIEQSLHNARTSARTIRAQNFPTVAALANFAKTTTVPLTEWLLYAVVHEAAMLNRRDSAGAWGTELSGGVSHLSRERARGVPEAVGGKRRRVYRRDARIYYTEPDAATSWCGRSARKTAPIFSGEIANSKKWTAVPRSLFFFVCDLFKHGFEKRRKNLT